MSLIIATGSNLGDKGNSLIQAKNILATHFKFISESNIYTSQAVDYINQPDFFNQVLEFEIPSNLSPDQSMELILKLEIELGRQRDIPKGPRTIDIDILFWNVETYSTKLVTIPHPRWSERSFVVLPLHELPFFQTIQKSFIIPTEFNNYAFKI
jgi:2-amino-4-hydroxy-6-hydroxymethyldihydropteridine diphosphokinase